MSEIQFNYDANFQLGVIQILVEDPTFAKKSLDLLKKSYFSNKTIGLLFDLVKGLYAEYDYVTYSMMENELFKFDEDKIEDYKALLKKVQKPQIKRNFKYIKENVAKFVKKAIAFKINQKLVNGQFKDPDKILENIEKDVDAMKGIDFDNQKYFSLKDLTKVMEESAENEDKLLALGLPDIDRAMGGGIPRGTLTVVLGGTNVGKSLFLLNSSWKFLQDGFKVLYLNLEGQDTQPLLRIASRAIKVPYGRVRFNNLNEKEIEKKNKFISEYKDDIRIYHMGDWSYTLEKFIALCEDVKEEFPFDVVMVDYGQILKTSQKFNTMREQMSYVHRGLASIASMHDCAVITVAQGNRDAQNKNNQGNLLRLVDVAECFDMTRAAATVLTLNRSDKDIASETIRILLEKQRDGAKGIVQICKTDMSYAAMYGSEEEGLGFISSDEYGQDQSPSHDNSHAITQSK